MFAPYKLLIQIVLLGALSAGTIYGVHRFLLSQQQIGYDKAEAIYVAKINEAKSAADKEALRMSTQLTEAQNAAIKRETNLRATVAAGTAASAELRSTLGNLRVGISTASADALRITTTALATVFGECQGRYIGMAEKADRHASDVKTLTDAWPKTK